MKCDILMKIIEYKIKSDDNENGDYSKNILNVGGYSAGLFNTL